MKTLVISFQPTEDFLLAYLVFEKSILIHLRDVFSDPTLTLSLNMPAESKTWYLIIAFSSEEKRDEVLTVTASLLNSASIDDLMKNISFNAQLPLMATEQ